MEEKERIQLQAIKNGTAIDHIEAGKALKLLEVLDIPESVSKGIAMNVESKKLSKKDLIFIDNFELSQKDFAKIGLVSKNATINIIKNHKVVKKIKAEIPNIAIGIIRCINPNCITNHEKVKTKFYIFRGEKIKAKCHYCERFLNEEEIFWSIK